MGIDPLSLTNEALERMAPEDRQMVAARVGHPNAALTNEEAVAKHLRRLERNEQKTLANWFSLQEERGILVYDWCRTDKKSTTRAGMPDFRVFRGSQALLGEMKMEGAKLSPDQELMREKFSRAGTEVQIWPSALAGIEATKNWLITHCAPS